MSTNHQPEDKIPEVVAGLEMLTVTNSNTTPAQTTKRVLRRRINQNGIINRRCSQKPIKRTFSEVESEEAASVYYLNKSVKRSPNSLETIYEEGEKGVMPSSSKSQMGMKRFKRLITFQMKPSDAKIKKRRLKIKKAFGSKSFRSQRLELKDVLKRLELIQSDFSKVQRDE